jgi:hypothetical protein
MFALPNGAYPTASRRFIEAVRDYRRKLKLRPEPQVGNQEWYALMRGGDGFSVSALLRSHFHQPLIYSRLHLINWRAARPRLFVSIAVDSRDGLYLSVNSSDQVDLRWGYGFREHYRAAQRSLREITGYFAPDQVPFEID